MSSKNILVTAIKNNENHHRCRYYYGEDESQFFFCDAMASGEAGAKKVLSKVNIDEIIAIGSELQVVKGESLNRVSLADGIDYIQADLDAMSDLDFFRYRLMEYIRGVDMEAADIAMSVPAEVQNKLVKEICDKLGYAPKKLFSHLHRSSKLKVEFMEALASYSDAEQEWIKRYLYISMDDRYKFHSRTTNFNLPFSFIPVADVGDNDRKNMKNLHQLLSSMKESAEDEIHLYIDIHGFTPEESYVFLSFFFALSDSNHSNIYIESINSLSDIPEGILYRISDARKRYRIERLLSGINAFNKYGKADMISDYWRESKISCPSIERLIYAMNSVDTGISFCNIDVIERGIKIFSEIVNEKDELATGSEEEMFLKTLKQGIIADYGPLITAPGVDLNYLDLIRWAFNKGLYQQAITIIESRLPIYMVKNGLFYYAKDETTKSAFLAVMNAYYWDSPPKDRWILEDPEHYFVKTYGRCAVGKLLDKTKTRSQVFSEIRAAQVFDEEKNGLLPAYSIIDDKQIFFNMLNAYFDIGILRNHINHANLEGYVATVDKGCDLPIKQIVASELTRVINAFAAAEKYVGTKKFDIAYISPEEFMDYTFKFGPKNNPDYNKVPGYVPSEEKRGPSAVRGPREPRYGRSENGCRHFNHDSNRSLEHHKDGVSVTVSKNQDDVTVKLHWD